MMEQHSEKHIGSKPIIPFVAIFFAIVSLGVLSSDWLLFAILVSALSVRLFRFRRNSVDIVGQIIIALFTAALVYGVFFLIELFQNQTRALFYVGVAIATAFLLTLILRLHILNPFGGAKTDGFLLLWVWLFLGFGNHSKVYAGLAVVGVLLVFLSVFYPGKKKKAFFRLKKNKYIFAVMLVGVTIMSVAFIYVIPLSYKWAMNRYLYQFSMHKTVFSPLLELGAVSSMLQSNEIVLRMFNSKEPITHLRGAVYNTYNGAHWTLSVPKKKEVFKSSVKVVNTVRMKKENDSNILFLPLGTKEVFLDSAISKNNLGIFYALQSEDVDEYFFEYSASEKADILLPTEQDLHVPSHLKRVLHKLSREWLGRFSTEEEKIIALKSKLHKNNSYSLEFERDPDLDPLIDFLTLHKSGHCEYFASSLALLLRTANVPTRVVGGYAVNEYNPYGEYHIVRQRNAHTWVEAWIQNKGWVTVEATPPAFGSRQSNTIALIFDYIPLKMKELLARLGEVNEWFVVGTIGSLLLLWIFLRLLRKKKRAENKRSPVFEYREAEFLVIELQQYLKDDVPKQKNESIEQWVSKFDLKIPKLKNAAAILQMYAAWRFGNVGRLAEIQSQYVDWKEKNGGQMGVKSTHDSFRYNS